MDYFHVINCPIIGWYKAKHLTNINELQQFLLNIY